MFEHIIIELKSRYRFPAASQKWTPSARTTGMGSTSACADQVQKLWRNASGPISSGGSSGNGVIRLPMSRSGMNQDGSQHRRTGCAVEKLAHASPAEPLSVVDDQGAAQVDHLREPLELPAFIKVVVGTVLGNLDSIAQGPLGIPDHHVGVGAGRQRALAREQTEDLGWVGGGEGDELTGSDAAGSHPVGPQNRQPISDARKPVGDFGEVGGTELFPGDSDRVTFVVDRFRPVQEEGAVIGTDRLDKTVVQALPKRGLVHLRPQR